jgi:mannose-6-phosphate isomerase-like protein (cupin superfamily)
MIALLCFFLTLLVSPFKSKSRLGAENAALRHQLIVLQRKVRGRVHLTNGDRLLLVQLYRWFSSVLKRPTVPAGKFHIAIGSELDFPCLPYGTDSRLKAGGYDLNLTRVTFPAGMPSNPPHHRSGAALYYIVSGTGANTVDGTTKARGPDSLIYEPFGLVHQWGNPGGEPLTFLAFNINPDGVAAVLPDAPAKAQ